MFDESLKEDGAVQTDLMEKLEEGYVYRLCCRRQKNILDYTTLICSADDVDLSYNKVEMYIENDAGNCTFLTVNHGVETGFYQRRVFKKDFGLVKHKRGFGAGRDHIEIDIKE